MRDALSSQWSKGGEVPDNTGKCRALVPSNVLVIPRLRGSEEEESALCLQRPGAVQENRFLLFAPRSLGMTKKPPPFIDLPPQPA
jgi:hypothetical protein